MMEIKTTSQIIKFAIEIGVIGEHNGMIICKSDRDKKWVAVDDLIGELKKASMLDICRLIKSLSTSQSEGTELPLKVPSQSSDKSCFCDCHNNFRIDHCIDCDTEDKRRRIKQDSSFN
ncbi:MAG: hypothetical protein AABY22_05805 [Nanoarchaeota archaeon]